jgi:hypothetical protein
MTEATVKWVKTSTLVHNFYGHLRPSAALQPDPQGSLDHKALSRSGINGRMQQETLP